MWRDLIKMHGSDFFITILLLITPEFKLEHGGVGSFLKCICFRLHLNATHIIF